MRKGLRMSSAAGMISLLDDSQVELKEFALGRIHKVVDEYWPEISDVISKIEVLYEDEHFGQRQLAALVASKVYYHLSSFQESLSYALGAGPLFDVTDSCEYVRTIIDKALDHYIKLRKANGTSGTIVQIDPRLEDIVSRMVDRSIAGGQHKQAIGIALETRRLDIFERAIRANEAELPDLMAYSFKFVMELIDNVHYRNEILKVLVELYKTMPVPDYISMVQCLIFLDDDKTIVQLLEKLIRQSDDSVLLAYQSAFDLYESATQQFLVRILDALRLAAPNAGVISSKTPCSTTPTSGSTTPASTSATFSSVSSTPASGSTPEKKDAASLDASKPETKKEDLSSDDAKRQDRIEKLMRILSGDVPIELDLQFLIRHNKTDMMILKQTKDAFSPHNSVCHNATVIANGLMNAGTTSDRFMRDNLDWLARTTNWAKFSATASLGVIHHRHEKEAIKLMAGYLPKDDAASQASGYSEGGGLYALGLIHANHGTNEIIDFLLNAVKGTAGVPVSERVKHGGCLALGLAAMATHRIDLYEQLKQLLFQDDAVTGEAAGLAMGLVMLGSAAPGAIHDLVAYASETQHEKILRGVSIGIALLMFARAQEADTLIETLCSDKDPIKRRSGVHTIAMAYCGTGNNEVIRKLLHVAVSDANDDVRRAAVEALGFILFRLPEQCPSVVSLLSESYNPNVRYGSAMALGISCAGTGNKEALAILEPLTNDNKSFVRQGALIGSALVLIQQTEKLCPKVKHFRALYRKIIDDKHEHTLAKFGAILAQGIIDAGGRNVTISLQSRTGHTNLPAVVGMLVFTQFWYWFPLAHFITLSFTPTAVIGLNGNLVMPKMDFKSDVSPSLFAYPEPLLAKEKKEREKVEAAVLSVTAKANKKVDDKVDDKVVVEKTKVVDQKTVPEPAFSMLANPSRVMPGQLKAVSLSSTRYSSVKKPTIGGIILLKDGKPSETEELVKPVASGGPGPEEEKEPEPPAPFEYIE